MLLFVQEVKLLFPNSQRLNRGNHEMKALITACRANDVTDFVVLHEHRGNPGVKRLIFCCSLFLYATSKMQVFCANFL